MVNKTYNEEEIKQYRKDFVTFVDEHDRRRGTKFLDTFTEFKDFYNQIKYGTS